MRNLKPHILLFLVIAGFSAVSAQDMKSDYDWVVAKDGSGDFTSVQDAIDATKSFPPDRRSIFIKDGVYEEKVIVHSWNTRLSIIGESRDGTIITWDDYFDKIDRGRNSTFHTYTFLVEGNDFHAENITIENSAGEVGQAIALSVDADRVSIENCKLLGNQDTLYLSGEGNRHFLKDCYIEGTTDFIFGGATAWIENSEIHSKKDSYITAASTPQGQDYGFIFKKCTLTADEQVNEVFLGRPWRNHAKTVFIESEMGNHIVSAGWHNWSKPEAEETVYYAEYANKGPGSDMSNRAPWVHQLTGVEANEYSLENVFKGWNPEH